MIIRTDVNGVVAGNEVFAFALTIDDGYESVHTLAFPVLREAKVHSTLFVATQFVDERGPLWPDRLEYAFAGAPGDADARRARLKTLQKLSKGLLPAERDSVIAEIEKELGRKLILDAAAPENYRPVTWAQCREMAESGLMEIGSHTHTHTIMTLPGNPAARELAASKELVEKHIGRPCDLFCYPNGEAGDYSAETSGLLKAGGFKCGLTTVAGFVAPGDDPCELPRFGTDDRDSFESFRMTFSLGRNLLQGVRRLFLYNHDER